MEARQDYFRAAHIKRLQARRKAARATGARRKALTVHVERRLTGVLLHAEVVPVRAPERRTPPSRIN